MEELKLLGESEGLTMSSKEIAELTGKRHDHVLRDCRELNANYLKMNITQIWGMEMSSDYKSINFDLR